jgi:hypothetical protein
LSPSKLSACSFNSRKSVTNTSHDPYACRQISAQNELQFEAAATMAKKHGHEASDLGLINMLLSRRTNPAPSLEASHSIFNILLQELLAAYDGMSTNKGKNRPIWG